MYIVHVQQIFLFTWLLAPDPALAFMLNKSLLPKRYRYGSITDGGGGQSYTPPPLQNPAHAPDC